jgi:ribonucleoside-triphosphate reductase
MQSTSTGEKKKTVNQEPSTIFTSIRKRDGRFVDFDAEKITRAILKAGRASGEFSGDIARKLTVRVLGLTQVLARGDVPTVEEIQDVVEDVLLTSTFKKTAKAYILYRDQHARIREMISQADVDLIDNYLEKLDWKVRENSNMAYSLQGLNNYISSEVSKTYWLNKIYTAEVREAHSSGALHIHDLGLLSVYCVGKAESKPAKHFSTALGQIVNFFYTLQGEAAGAQAFSNFDTLLAPFIRYDGLSYREVKQALQAFVFNVNVPTRVGFQTPFTNLTLDLQPPATLANEAAIIGGTPMKETYGEFGEEMVMLNRAFLEVLAEGDARGRVFTFPIPTYNISADFDWDAPGLERLWEVTAKYGIPYFANFVNADLSPDDARSMCCRLRLDLRALEKRGGGLFGANPLTGSIGVVTINMPRIGHLSETEDEFLDRLGHLMEIARTSLETKRKVLEGFTEKNLYPYTKYYLRNMRERHGCYWFNHFSTIGLVGLNEACLNFHGVTIGDPKGAEFACRTLDFMREKLRVFQEETGNFYNLEATPAEEPAPRRLHRRRVRDARSPGRDPG